MRPSPAFEPFSDRGELGQPPAITWARQGLCLVHPELERGYYLQQIKQLLDLPPEERERFNVKLAKEG